MYLNVFTYPVVDFLASPELVRLIQSEPAGYEIVTAGGVARYCIGYHVTPYAAQTALD